MVDTQYILTFLSELERNNNRSWFQEHKVEYQKAKQEFEELVQELMIEIGKFDESVLSQQPKDLIFRINRDTRFGSDPSPYHTAFRAHISGGGKLPVPVGYFLSFQPGAITLGGGLFMDSSKEATQMIRSYLCQHDEEFAQILAAPSFQKRFRVLGTKLKKVPKEYDETLPCSDYLKHKSWFIECNIPDEIALEASDFIKEAGLCFESMLPFQAFINTALKDFKMPQRR